MEESSTASTEPSEHLGPKVDAMGQEKRRAVVGNSYGPSKTKQLAYYGGAIALIVALFVGGKMATDELDKPPATNPDQAPWAQEGSPQIPPQRFE